MTYLSIIAAAAKAAHVPFLLLYAICSHESRDFTLDYSANDNNTPSFSVCQVKKTTAEMFGWKGTDEMELRNPYIGIRYAALYLKYQLDNNDDDWMKATAAYNSGTYNKSSHVLGCPRNLKYLRLVQQKLDANLQYKLECGKWR